MKGKGKNKGKKPGIAREITGASESYEERTTNPNLKAAILEVVENQLRENNPPKRAKRSNSFLLQDIHVKKL